MGDVIVQYIKGYQRQSKLERGRIGAGEERHSLLFFPLIKGFFNESRRRSTIIG